MAKSYLDKMRDIVKKAEDAQQMINKIESKSEAILNLIGEAYEVCDEADVDARIKTFESQIKSMIDEKKQRKPLANVGPSALQALQNSAATSQQIQ